jgi:hypothetical protein
MRANRITYACKSNVLVVERYVKTEATTAAETAGLRLLDGIVE